MPLQQARLDFREGVSSPTAKKRVRERARMASLMYRHLTTPNLSRRAVLSALALKAAKVRSSSNTGERIYSSSATLQ
jgi:hypothetical protein